MRGIRFKLWAGMMALVGIVLVLLWFFQIGFLENFYKDMRISSVRKQAETLVKSQNSNNGETFEQELNSFAYNNNLTLELFDANGNTLLAAGGMTMGNMPMMMNNSRQDAFQKALEGKESIIPVAHPRFGNEFELISFPFYTNMNVNGKLAGVCLVTMPMAPVKDTANILKWQLLLITVILIVSALFISYLLSKNFTRPVFAIKKVAEKMAAGDLSARIETNRHDEFGKLSETINNMGDQLAKTDQLRKDLIANVSHELRTPLTLIRGYAETMRDVTGDDREKRQKHLGVIIDETERLGFIVDDILNLSQLQSGNIKLQNSKFSINGTIDSVLKVYDVISEQKGIKLTFEGPALGIVEADEQKIKQVFYNLINNAFNHTPSGGRITIKGIEKPKTVRIEIQDTGRGIKQEDLPHIWDRYYKTQKDESKKTTGTGLGLAIVREILKAHNADFGIDSVEGEGTSIWFELSRIF